MSTNPGGDDWTPRIQYLDRRINQIKNQIITLQYELDDAKERVQNIREYLDEQGTETATTQEQATTTKTPRFECDRMLQSNTKLNRQRLGRNDQTYMEPQPGKPWIQESM